MSSTFPEQRRSGLERLENELIVRDFLEVLPFAEPAELMPFLHAEVRFEGGPDGVAEGRQPVLRAWGSVAARFHTFQVEVVTAAPSDGRVLVEQRIVLSMTQHASPRPALGLAAFDLIESQIIGWKQLFG